MITNYSINITKDAQGVAFRTPDSNWVIVNPRDWAGYTVIFRGFKSPFTMFGFPANKNIKFLGYKITANSTQFWNSFNEGGSGIIDNREVIMDRYNIINKIQYKNLGGQTILGCNFPNSGVISQEWVTNIAGKHCGVRTKIKLTSNGDEYIDADYDFINVLSLCPDTVKQNTNGEWRALYTQEVNSIKEYIGVMSLIAINGVNVQTEDQACEWLSSYNTKEDVVKQKFLDWMNSFKEPPLTFTEEQKNKYYMVLQNFYMGVHMPAMDHPEQAGVTDRFNINGRTRHYLTPNIAGYNGMWIWDSAMALQGIMSALETPSPYLIEVIQDVLLIWAATQEKYPIINQWEGSVHINAAGNISQPADLYVPIVLEAYKKGIISYDFLKNAMYPALRSHYENYKQKAGGNYLLSVGASYGRDGTHIAPDGGSNSAETGIVGDFAMMAIGMATIAQICGEDYSSFVLDHKNIKQNFNEKMWRPEYNIYWNLQNNQFKDGNLSGNIGTTPFGVGMLIIADLVPSERIKLMFDVLETNFVDRSVYAEGIGYTSVPITASYYDPHTQWDGPTWDWVDNILCIQAILSASKRYNLQQQLKVFFDKILNREIFFIGLFSEQCLESYQSTDGGFATWSSRPYIPSGNALVIAMTGVNLYENLNYDLLDDSYIPPPPEQYPVFQSLTFSPNIIKVGDLFSIIGQVINADAVYISGPDEKGLNEQRLDINFIFNNIIIEISGQHVFYFRAVNSPPGEVPLTTEIELTITILAKDEEPPTEPKGGGQVLGIILGLLGLTSVAYWLENRKKK